MLIMSQILKIASSGSVILQSV